MPVRRNLAAWEIVEQVIAIQRDSPHPVRGVVFMGMGEPLLNYDNVIQAARVFSEPCGLAIGPRRSPFPPRALCRPSAASRPSGTTTGWWSR